MLKNCNKAIFWERGINLPGWREGGDPNQSIVVITGGVLTVSIVSGLELKMDA
jgi:hypothetical protein